MEKYKEITKNAIVRAIWTMCQVALSMITIGMGIQDIDWKNLISVTLVAGLYSLIKSVVVGMPETETDGSFIVCDDISNGKTNWILNYDGDPNDIPGKKSIRFKVTRSAALPEGVEKKD